MSLFKRKSHEEIVREVAIESLKDSFIETSISKEEQEKQIQNLSGYLQRTYSKKELSKELRHPFK